QDGGIALDLAYGIGLVLDSVQRGTVPSRPGKIPGQRPWLTRTNGHECSTAPPRWARSWARTRRSSHEISRCLRRYGETWPASGGGRPYLRRSAGGRYQTCSRKSSRSTASPSRIQSRYGWRERAPVEVAFLRRPGGSMSGVGGTGVGREWIVCQPHHAPARLIILRA